jgi:hypothetical protein
MRFAPVAHEGGPHSLANMDSRTEVRDWPQVESREVQPGRRSGDRFGP